MISSPRLDALIRQKLDNELIQAKEMELV